MQLISKILTLALFFPVVGLISCEEEAPRIPNPEELITTYIYILTPDDGSRNIVLSFEDLDREGGNPPSYLVDPIPANMTFTGAIQALDKTQSPILDVTPEIIDEDEGHQIFFSPEGIDLTITYDDMDQDGNPLGLTTKVSSGAAGTGTLKVTLKHEPDKFAAGVAGGDITHASGTKDVEAIFPIIIQ